MQLLQKFIFLIIISLTLYNSSFASLNGDIQTLIKKYGLSNASIGIAVQRTNSSKWLYNHHSNSNYTPASNNKVFTAVGALLTLSRSFSFETAAYYKKSNLKGHTLYGDLYINFTGDPTLTTSGLTRLIKQIKAKGINKINGNVIAIANTFSGSNYPLGWAQTDVNQCYAAPTSSMNLNRNCMIISIQSTGGSSTKVKPIFNADHIKINNKIKFVSKKTSKTCGFEASMNSRNTLDLNGCLPKRGEWRLKFAITNPALKTLQELEVILKKSRITYTGTLSVGDMPSYGLILLTSIHSGTLNYLLKHMLQRSDNLYAESLARAVGNKLNGSGTIKSGVSGITQQIHTKLDIETDNNLIMEDGSGLSHLDSVTPKFMAEFLTETYNNNKIGKTFYNALAVSGVSGTIAYRMNSKSLMGKVHAKTGTLSGTSTLSGYVLTKRVHRLSFSIMLNDLKSSKRKSARRFQDQVVTLLYNKL